MIKPFKNGLLTGLILQLAIGPVFFFIINLSLQKNIFDGLVAVIAVTLVDYFYITLSMFGVGKLLEKKKIKKIFGIVSSVILVVFGIIILKGITNTGTTTIINSSNLFTSFTATFFLTISNPMTIIFFTSLFAAKAVEYNYTKHELYIFGFATGLATFIFMGSSAVLFSFLRGTIPTMLIQILNLAVGCLLIGYGGLRLNKIIKH